MSENLEEHSFAD